LYRSNIQAIQEAKNELSMIEEKLENIENEMMKQVSQARQKTLISRIETLK
jgi:tetrahydromethanopterin S-methyltransferase subunit G